MEGEPILSNTAATMEVHHHAHTGRKTFRHYLFEFFMLFFAVFCGFLAEYFLEHTIEHKREKQFIGSMIKDLKDDTGRIAKVFEFNKKQVVGIDSLLKILYRKNLHPDTIDLVHRLYSDYALNYERVVFNNRTLSQLKNSGGMRLIRNQSVSDSIMNYDARIQNCDLQFEVVREAWTEESNFSFQIFDLGSVFMHDQYAPGTKRTFISTDSKIMTAYASRLLMFGAVVNGYAVNIDAQKQLAIRLISYLEKQYHLD
jgi:hypothetical protein